MIDATAQSAETRDIVIDEVFPHTPETLWKALTDGELIARWMMAPSDFAPVAGHKFTFTTKPAGEWDGTIRCEVLQVVPRQRLAYAWRGGHAGNAGYGSPLDTVVTWTLEPADGGTRLRMTHSGFVLPLNRTALTSMSEGWKTVMARLGAAIEERVENE